MRVAAALALAAAFPVLCACSVEGASGAERRYLTAGSSDEPSQGRAVLSSGTVEYELTAWHQPDGTLVDATVRNHGPGVLRLDPARASLVTAGGDEVPATPSGCGLCPPGGPCTQGTATAVVRDVPAGEMLRLPRCFAPVNPWAGRHGGSGADPSRLALTWRDEGLALDGTPLVVVIELTRR